MFYDHYAGNANSEHTNKNTNKILILFSKQLQFITLFYYVCQSSDLTSSFKAPSAL